MKSFLLDKRLSTNTDYTAESDTVYVVRKIGTSDTARVTAKVEGVPCGEFITDIAALMTSDANRNPLFPLGKLFVVIPSSKIFRFEGTGGEFVRIKGDILRLAPGESLPATYLARYTEQGKKYWDYQTAALEAAVTIPGGASADLLTFTCPAGEKWTFNDLVMAQAYVGTSKDYEVTSRLLLQDSPLDNLLNAKVLLGLTQYATPYPPTDANGAIPDTLKDRAIEVGPGKVFRLQVVNTSGTSKDVAATTTKCLLNGVRELL